MSQAKYILTLNCGSSSIKSKLFAMPGEASPAGLDVSDVGLKKGTWTLRLGMRTQRGHRQFRTYDDGLRCILDWYLHDARSPLESPDQIVGIAHRVVHGGPKYKDSVRITPMVIRHIKENGKLAPLHTPPNLKGIDVARKMLPDAAHIAVFDTGFHQTIPDYAAAYPLPYHFYKKHNIRRYGFHGISYRYVIGEAAKMMRRPLRELKLIACHLGSGCSVCAIDRGKSVDTSMGFTPVEGIMMRTRTGDLDPGVILHMQRVFGYTPSQLNRLLNDRSGFFGVSGGATTMPEVIKRFRGGDERAKLAFHMFCYRVEKYIGAYIATLGGLDGIIFTAGIGENQPDIRRQIIKWCRGFGITINREKNLRARGKQMAIHARSSRAAVLVIPTNEGLMMARDAHRIV